MNAPFRVGVVEIGSRAIRLLVADTQCLNGLTIVATDWAETGLVAAIGRDSETEVVSRVATIGSAFVDRSRELQAKRICVFGTEALRQISNGSLEQLKASIPEILVLDSQREAECSLLAAANGLECSGEVLAIDQGAASMEVAVGDFRDGQLQLKAATSYRLGTQPLVESLAKCGGDLKGFQSMLQRKIKRLRLVSCSAALRPILLGSAATKIAWIRVRKREDDRYNPKLVHGTVMAVDKIDQLIMLAEQSPDFVRSVIDPRNPNSSEYETVMAGLVGLRLVLERFKATEFAVSAFGTRHGMALRLARENEAR
jgi:exopolyphosphatase/pppGpp-phosphohydrolase